MVLPPIGVFFPQKNHQNLGLRLSLMFCSNTICSNITIFFWQEMATRWGIVGCGNLKDSIISKTTFQKYWLAFAQMEMEKQQSRQFNSSNAIII